MLGIYYALVLFENNILKACRQKAMGRQGIFGLSFSRHFLDYSCPPPMPFHALKWFPALLQFCNMKKKKKRFSDKSNACSMFFFVVVLFKVEAFR